MVSNSTSDHDKLIQLEERVSNLCNNIKNDKFELDTRLAVLDGLSEAMSTIQTSIKHLDELIKKDNEKAANNCELHRKNIAGDFKDVSKSISLFNKLLFGTFGLTIFGIIVVYIKEAVQGMFVRDIVNEVRIISDNFLEYIKNNK